MKKTCTKCKKELPANSINFNKQKNGKYGLRSTCKSCSREIRRVYTSTDEYKKKHREKMSKWRKENPERMLEISRKNYKINGHKYNAIKREKLKTDEEYREKVRLREKRYRESGRRKEMNQKPENMEKARIRSRERRKDKEKIEHDYANNAKWREANRDIIRKKDREKRLNLDDSYLAQSMRVSVKDIPNEVLETRRIIIQIKRELKSKNVKIK